MSDEATELRMVLADIIVNAVLHPEIRDFEFVPREELDKARMHIDHGDLVAVARRIRESEREK